MRARNCWPRIQHCFRCISALLANFQRIRGSRVSYPKHFPRNNDAGYFPQGDMSAWSGDSTGVKHMRMRLPGMAGTVAQLRFEYTQDGSAICSDVRPGHSCGVLVDNVTVNSVVAQPHQ